MFNCSNGGVAKKMKNTMHRYGREDNAEKTKESRKNVEDNGQNQVKKGIKRCWECDTW